MSKKAILAACAVVLAGLLGTVLLFTAGKGTFTYVPSEAAQHREKGEFLLNKRRHTTDEQKKAELLTQAIAEFKAAATAKPDFEVAYNMLGHCYIERGQWEDALKSLDRALELRPDYPVARFNRALVYQRLSVGKRGTELLDKAIADYKAALESELAAPFVGDIHKGLADAYYQKGDIRAAIAELNLYLEKAPHAGDATTVQRKIRGLTLQIQGAAPLEGDEAPPAPAQP